MVRLLTHYLSCGLPSRVLWTGALPDAATELHTPIEYGKCRAAYSSRPAEIYRDLGFKGNCIAVTKIGLVPPLSDCVHSGPGQQRISVDNLHGIDLAILVDDDLQHDCTVHSLLLRSLGIDGAHSSHDTAVGDTFWKYDGLSRRATASPLGCGRGGDQRRDRQPASHRGISPCILLETGAPGC